MKIRNLRTLSGMMAALLLLTACAKPTVPESSASSGESISEPVLEYATDDITDHRKVSMDFDNIQPAGYFRAWGQSIPQIEHGYLQYFTIERDGKWGLILADGTQILPCLSMGPVSLCDQLEWGWDGGEEINWLEASEESMLLTDFPTCGGHCGGSSTRFVDLNSESKKPKILHSMGASGEVEEDFEDPPFCSYYATYFCDFDCEEGEIPYLPGGGYWNFTDEDGKVLFPEEQFSMVSEFGRGRPATVQKDGKWAYVGESGEYLTDFIYEAGWFALGTYDEHGSYTGYSFPNFAYPFYLYFTPVKKDGKWGVMDNTGTMRIPCEYEGASPHPLGAWLKKDGVWEVQRLI